MKICTLFDFMAEMKPWLDQEYIRSAYVDIRGNFVLQFVDGTKNIYAINDCNKQQINKVLKELKHKGIQTAEL